MFDGDIIMTTNQKEFIEKRLQNSVPITYPKRTAIKHKINPKNLYDSDMDSFDSQIGYVTNCSTAMYVMLEKFDKDSLEYKELKKRLLITRKLQGDAIDQAKGIKTDPFPQHWVDRRKCEDSYFNMSLVIKKKPYFQKYIYPKLMQECKKFEENMENYSYTIFGISSKENKDEQFLKIKNDLNPVLDYPSVMIRLCHYLEEKIPEIKINSKKIVQDIVDDILIDYDYEIKFEYEEFVKSILKEYKQFRHDKRKNEDEEETVKNNFYFYCKNLRKKLIEKIGNEKDMANIVVYVAYSKSSQEDKDFAWNVCGNDILKNVIKNRQEEIYIPIEDENGELEYLGKKYTRKAILGKYDYFG